MYAVQKLFQVYKGILDRLDGARRSKKVEWWNRWTIGFVGSGGSSHVGR